MTYENPVGHAVHKALVMSAVAAGVLGAPVTNAQNITPVEEVIVTGSRISRPDLEASSPVSVVTAADFQMAGTSNAEQFLRDLPQLVPAVGSNANNGNPGVSTLDLRNLHEERTMVLVDGRRFIPYDSNGVVDVNMIPSALIERVEIVTGGASAVYGSDAIAGVVNFILKDDFEGIELSATNGQSMQNDGNRQDYSLTVGSSFAEDRGNMVFNVGYTRQEAVYQGDREFSEFSLSSKDFSPGGSSTNAAGVLLDVFTGVGNETATHVFDPNGNLIPYVAERDAFNFNPYNLLQTPEEKWTATILGKYEINDRAEFFSRFSFANTQVKTILAPSGTFNFNFDFNYRDNPFLTEQARSVLARNDEDNDGVVNLQWGRRTVEMGTRDSIYENTAWQGVVGLRGDISNSWGYEVYAQQGRTVRTLNFLNDVDATKLQEAILAVRDPNTGEIVCTSGNDLCVPVNMFGAGTLTPEMADYIRLNLSQVDTTEQFVAGGFVTGDLPFASPLASSAPAMVFGIEYRSEEGESKPDNPSKNGDAPGFGQSMPLEARLSIREVYTELKIPLISDRTLVHSLGLEAGIRQSEYGNAVPQLNARNDFSTTAWKIGGDWAPVEDIRFRALFQRAVRAPNLNEIGAPRVNGTGDAGHDYCSKSFFTPEMVNDSQFAGLRDLCIATGVPSDRLGFVTDPIAGQVSNYSGGNPNLAPEESDTITAGVVLQPSFLPGFTASIDYFDIKVEKAILDTPEQAILDACYTIEQNPTLDPNNMFCQLIHRSSGGSLNGGLDVGVDQSDRNIGYMRAKGIDLLASYAFDVGSYGNLALSLNLTRQLATELQFTPTAETIDCVGLVGEVCLRPTPETQWIQMTTWSYGPVALQLRWRHIGELEQDQIVLAGVSPSEYMVPVIDSFDYFDLSGSYDLNDAVTLRAGIHNLLDKDPPVVGNDYGGTRENSGNTYPQTYEVLGRSFFVSVTARF